jgi:hypothetical protein
VQRFDIQYVFRLGASGNFALENGAEQLVRLFTTVELHRFQDGLVVTEAQPLIDYILSGRVGAELEGQRAAQLATFIEHELADHGSLTITKDTGLFEAW